MTHSPLPWKIDYRNNGVPVQHIEDYNGELIMHAVSDGRKALPELWQANVEFATHSVNTLPQVEEQLAKAKELLTRLKIWHLWAAKLWVSSELKNASGDFYQEIDQFLKENQ